MKTLKKRIYINVNECRRMEIKLSSFASEISFFFFKIQNFDTKKVFTVLKNYLINKLTKRIFIEAALKGSS